ncbi:TPA: DNA/RNA non-specific endonuclease [Streptococcus agalactiae]
MKRLHKLFITVIATLGMLGVMTFGLPTQPQNVTPIVHADVNSSVDTSQEFQNNLKNAIGNLPFQYVNGIYELNNNQTNLNADVNVKAYVQNTIDNQQRLSTANAMLDRTIRQYQNRRDTTLPDANWKPLGWHQVATNDHYGHAVDKGHLIAYALAGNFKGWDASVSNPQNVVTQTAHSNQSNQKINRGQNYYESLVRKAVDQNKRVRYRVTPLYRNDTDLVPFTMHLEAKSQDGTLEFNVAIPNTQASYTMDYATGEITLN